MIFCCKYKGSARVVDGKLMLSYPQAVKPVVWQMDLNAVKASALETEKALLQMKTPEGTVTPIAEFKDPKQATNALMGISKALSNAQGKIAVGGGMAMAPQNGGFWRKFLMIVLGLVVLFVLFKLAAGPNPQTLRLSDNNINPVTKQVPNPRDAAGVPVDADAYLSAP